MEPEEREKADMAISAFYAIWETIKSTAARLELLAGDCRIVDAIYAAEDVQRRKSTLKSEN